MGNILKTLHSHLRDFSQSQRHLHSGLPGCPPLHLAGENKLLGGKGWSTLTHFECSHMNHHYRPSCTYIDISSITAVGAKSPLIQSITNLS